MKRTITALLALLLALGLYLATAQNNQQGGQGNAAQQGAQQGTQQAGQQGNQQGGQQGDQQGAQQGDGQGAQIYQQCAVCHGSNGQGGSGPALAGNKNIQDATYQIDTILNGRGAMPSWAGALSDAQIAAVATHERTSWGNDFGEVTTQQVTQQRGNSGGKAQNAPTTAKVTGFDTMSNDQFGTLLATSDGVMVYRFVNDRIDGQSHCYNPCTTHWLPVTTGNSSPQLSNSLNPAGFGSIQRDSNTTQVTYEGWPLYVYAADQAQVQQAQQSQQQSQGNQGSQSAQSAQGQSGQNAQSGQGNQSGNSQQGNQNQSSQGAQGTQGGGGDQSQQSGGQAGQNTQAQQGGQQGGQQGQQSQAGQSAQGQQGTGQQGASQQGADQSGQQGASEQSGQQNSVDGSQVYTQAGCVSCHGQNGEGGAGPALAGNNNLQDTQHVVNQILNGGGGMPAFSNQLSAAEIAAVATHERTSWGNNFGSVSGICLFVVAGLLGSIDDWRVDPGLLGWAGRGGSLLEAVRVSGARFV